MLTSATYICPVRGLARLEPPEPERFLKAARIARGLGIDRLHLPVLEEPLTGTARFKVGFLDGLVRALDQVTEAGLTASLIAPATKVLGLAWVPPYLVGGFRDPGAPRVFVDGRIRNLWPLDWWIDPPLIEKRIKIFKEVVAAVHGHPALTGWVILDRALEWTRPDPQAADFVLRAFLAEIRERDETATVTMGLGWSELLAPELVQTLANQMDGLRMCGLENNLSGLPAPADLGDELLMVAYLGAMARWLFGRPTEVEIGWGLVHRPGDPEKIMESLDCFARQGLSGISWLSLVDPVPNLQGAPPWALRPGLEKAGLLDHHLEPKEQVETWLSEAHSEEKKAGTDDFVDVSMEEYLSDPHTHLPRLWNHFLASR